MSFIETGWRASRLQRTRCLRNGDGGEGPSPGKGSGPAGPPCARGRRAAASHPLGWGAAGTDPSRKETPALCLFRWSVQGTVHQKNQSIQSKPLDLSPRGGIDTATNFWATPGEGPRLCRRTDCPRNAALQRCPPKRPRVPLTCLPSMAPRISLKVELNSPMKSCLPLESQSQTMHWGGKGAENKREHFSSARKQVSVKTRQRKRHSALGGAFYREGNHQPRYKQTPAQLKVRRGGESRRLREVPAAAC